MIIIDELKSIDVHYLKRRGFLKQGRISEGSIIWSIEGQQTASIRIKVDCTDNPSIQFNYSYNGVIMEYKAELVIVRSNLGKGVRYYFRCPISGKSCLKLHLYKGQFLHKSSLPNGIYLCQLVNKTDTDILVKVVDAMYQNAELYEELKSIKQHYQGEPTRRALSIMNKIEKNDNVIGKLNQTFTN
jgi:hypothetical protein